MERINLSSGTPWEQLIGFSRIVQVGSQIFISGTTAINSKGEVIGIGDPYLQTKRVIENIKNAMESIGASLNDVTRTRLFVTDMARWESYTRAHQEAFHAIRPACTIVGVSRLIDARMLIDMEVEAVRGSINTSDIRMAQY